MSPAEARSLPGTSRRAASAGSPASRTAWPNKAALLLASVLFAAYCLLPVWWLVVSATKNSAELYGTSGFWFAHGFDLVSNLRELFDFQSHIFVRWIVNTLGYAVIGSALATLIAAGAGFVFAKYRFAGRRFCFALVLGGVLLPPNILAIPLYLLFSQAHATNTYWSVFLPSLVSPFGVYLCRIYAEAGVPDELLEAARMDGAGEIHMFWSIALRLMRPALITVFLFQLVAIWNNVLLPLVMLNDQHLYPITLGLYSMYASSSAIGAPPNVTALVVTGVLVSVIPLIIAFLALQRYWRGGVAVGAIRG
jgi:multiple sugar transport system permease protein